jgi:O-methyltransferase involved in polyketide biosynthesis
MSDYLEELAKTGKLASIEKPSSARVYDYYLGGTNNYAMDREFAKVREREAPDIADVARANRAFAGRAVRFALEQGVTQFIDIGSGLPSKGQAHEIADEVAPEAQVHVVYIDNEPVAQAHSEYLIDKFADPGRHAAIYADYAQPEALWAKVLESNLIDTAQPVCLVLTSLLHFIPEENRYWPLAWYRDHVAPGSLLVLSSLGTDDAELRAVQSGYQNSTNPVDIGTPDQFAACFADWELVEPGVKWIVEWRAVEDEYPWWDDEPRRSRLLAGVAVKPANDAVS